MEVVKPLFIGQPAEKESELKKVVEKEGRTGPLLVAEWRHRYCQGGTTAIEEWQTVIYRPEASRGGAPGRPAERGASEAPVVRQEANLQVTGPAWQMVRRLEFDPIILFRFSAATWNSHRIHYDRGYAESEGYPGLLVQGPLLAVLMAGQAQLAIGDLRTLEYRAHSPVFDTDVVDLYLRRDPATCWVEVRRPDGSVTSSLSAATQPS